MIACCFPICFSSLILHDDLILNQYSGHETLASKFSIPFGNFLPKLSSTQKRQRKMTCCISYISRVRCIVLHLLFHIQRYYLKSDEANYVIKITIVKDKVRYRCPLHWCKADDFAFSHFSARSTRHSEQTRVIQRGLLYCVLFWNRYSYSLEHVRPLARLR